MRSDPEYTRERRPAMPPAADDFMQVWQKHPVTGVYQQRWIRRDDSEERTLLIVDQDRAEMTEEIRGMVAAQAEQQRVLDAMLAQQAALIAELQARKQLVALPEVTVTANQLLNLAGERTFPNLPCAGVRTTDTVFIAIKSRPAGIGLIGWSVPTNGRVTLTVQCPPITIGTTALVVTVTAFR